MTKRYIWIVFVIAASLLCVAGIFYFYNWYYLWSPEPEWDKSPQNKIISISEVWTEVDYNYIPDVQIWGDGYIVWVEYSEDGSRKVFEGYLSQQELGSIVQKLIEIDFFKRSRKGKDNAGNFISVHLLNADRSEWIDRNNKQLFDLVVFLQQGAGAIGRELVPSVGTLYAYPIEETGHPADTKVNFFWADDKFGYSLDDLTDKNDGIEILGDELEFAWQVVNSPNAAVMSKDRVYWIFVMLPKISY